jgi:tetratricopeptide (TPR) repeat protein
VPRDHASTLRTAEALLAEGQTGRALEHFREVADRLLADGFHAKAGAVLRKILRIHPDDDAALNQLGDIAVREERPTEARRYYMDAAARRMEAGDAAGAGAIQAKLRSIDTGLAIPLITADIEGGDLAAAKERIITALAGDPAALATIAAVAEQLAPAHPDAIAACVDAFVDHALAGGNPNLAVELLRRFAGVLPGRIPILLRLVEVGAETGLEAITRDAQAGLADAYLAEGWAHEARVISEDLVTRDRSNAAHVERLRQSLHLLGEADAERLIAERLDAAAVDPLELLQGDATRPDRPAGPVQADSSVGPAPDLDDVFAELRAAADMDPVIDGSEHYVSLARESMDAGRTREAIEALLQAAKSPKRRFRCAVMLAQLYRDIGDIPRAIEWYERGAEVPPASPEDGARLLYDLGDLLETMGENGRALAVFMEIEAEAPGFLDVTARISRLSPDQVEG